jgi:V8-like Glu-specific endopeptidase
MKLPVRALGALGLVSLLVIACNAPQGESEDESGPAQSESSIVGGTPITGDPAVFQLKTVTPINGGSSIEGCTATLVAPKVLVTAAHCIEDAKPNSVAWVNNQPVPQEMPSAAGGWRRAAKIQKHPSYPQQYMNLGYDCAVIVLEEPVTGVAPKPYRKTQLGPGGLGQPARIVGYGNTNGRAGTGSGTKRELATKIKEVRDGVLTIGKLGAVSCQGDSGGPAFISEGGVETIAGISSYGDIGCVESGSYARTELCAAFFDSFTQQTCTPQCTGKVCGSDGCGGVCGTCETGKACTQAGQCVATPVTPPPGGGGGGSSGGVTPPPPPGGASESEPNDFLGSTNRFGADGTVRGVLSGGGDNDFYVIDIPAGSVYDVTFAAAGPSLGLTVYKDTGNSIYAWDGNAERRVYMQTSTGGRYYVKAYYRSPGAGGDAYTLKVAITRP